MGSCSPTLKTLEQNQNQSVAESVWGKGRLAHVIYSKLMLFCMRFELHYREKGQIQLLIVCCCFFNPRLISNTTPDGHHPSVKYNIELIPCWKVGLQNQDIAFES